MPASSSETTADRLIDVRIHAIDDVTYVYHVKIYNNKAAARHDHGISLAEHLPFIATNR